MKKLLLAVAISLSFIGSVEAAELYDVIHQAVINAGSVPNYFETRQYVVNVANNY
jgi:predicted porin